MPTLYKSLIIWEFYHCCLAQNLSIIGNIRKLVDVQRFFMKTCSKFIFQLLIKELGSHFEQAVPPKSGRCRVRATGGN